VEFLLISIHHVAALQQQYAIAYFGWGLTPKFHLPPSNFSTAKWCTLLVIF